MGGGQLLSEVDGLIDQLGLREICTITTTVRTFRGCSSPLMSSSSPPRGRACPERRWKRSRPVFRSLRATSLRSGRSPRSSPARSWLQPRMKPSNTPNTSARRCRCRRTGRTCSSGSTDRRSRSRSRWVRTGRSRDRRARGAGREPAGACWPVISVRVAPKILYTWADADPESGAFRCLLDMGMETGQCRRPAWTLRTTRNWNDCAPIGSTRQTFRRRRRLRRRFRCVRWKPCRAFRLGNCSSRRRSDPISGTS